jgi:hypothetical protein
VLKEVQFGDEALGCYTQEAFELLVPMLTVRAVRQA